MLHRRRRRLTQFTNISSTNFFQACWFRIPSRFCSLLSPIPLKHFFPGRRKSVRPATHCYAQLTLLPDSLRSFSMCNIQVEHTIRLATRSTYIRHGLSRERERLKWDSVPFVLNPKNAAAKGRKYGSRPSSQLSSGSWPTLVHSI